MLEYWKKVLAEAHAEMQKLIDKFVDDKVENDCADMKRALAYVLKHGNSKKAADAIDYFGDYKKAMREIAAHSAVQPPAAKV